MPFNFRSTGFPGLMIVEPSAFEDQRGSFNEVFKLTDFKANGIDKNFVQANISRSHKNVLRGLHYQNPPAAQGKLVGCLQGEVFDVVVDIRRGSPTYGKSFALTLNDKTRTMLYIPEGFAHGFYVLSEEAQVIYYCTSFYSQPHERSLIWNDPAIGIKWPGKDPILSDKDKNASKLDKIDNQFYFGQDGKLREASFMEDLIARPVGAPMVQEPRPVKTEEPKKVSKKILISGSQGQLAKEFIAAFKTKGTPCAAPEENIFDITSEKSVRMVIERERPSVLINCAAYNQVDLAEENEEIALKVNTEAVRIMAKVCKENNVFFVHFSSDYVFDGEKGSLYIEEDRPHPLNTYGESKWKGEEAVKKEAPDHLILRLSWVFGLGQMNFLYKLSEWAASKTQLKITDDEISVPTYTEDVVKITLAALEKNLKGLYHAPNSGFCSRYDWAKYYFAKLGKNMELIPASMAEFKTKARRPHNAAMSNKKIAQALGMNIPTWQSAVDRYIQKYE